MSTTVRRLALPAALLVVGLAVGIGAVTATGHHDAPQEASDAFEPISQNAIAADERHSQARWAHVATFAGYGRDERGLRDPAEAVQWTTSLYLWGGAAGIMGKDGLLGSPLDRPLPGLHLHLSSSSSRW